jgi:hypothetical protein
VSTGINNVTIGTATSYFNQTGGSMDDRAIFTFLVKNSLGYSAVGGSAEGCKWTLEYEDGTNGTATVPTSYSGNKTCFYENATYSSDDSLDVSFFNILSYFDFDNDGLIDVSISDDSIKTEHITLEGVPSLWGPALVEVRVWQ